MKEDFNASQPIYQQLVQRICRKIVRGNLNTGEKLPSVREMGIQSGVNPNTVQRAYAELERLEIVETKRGLGTFITENKTRLEVLRTELMHEQITTFIRDMREMGFTSKEIINGVNIFLLENGETGGIS